VLFDPINMQYHYTEMVTRFLESLQVRLNNLERFLNSRGADISKFHIIGEDVTAMEGIQIGQGIFVVHGHDHDLRDKVVDYLRDDLGLAPVVMEIGAYEGRTTPEKFEDTANECAYAVIICTPDDELYDVNKSKKVRIRQNVVLELGYFWGRLGRRKRLAVLLRKVDGLDLPSDIEALGYTEITSDLVETKKKLRKELVAAGVIKPE